MARIEEAHVDAARRWRSARDAIDRTRKEGPLADSPERIAKFIKHQADTGSGELLWAGARPPRLSGQIVQDQVVGSSDLISFSTLQKAVAIGRFVGRVACRAHSGGIVGVGTGSMVSPRLMLTNHHVIRSSADAVRYLIQFNYQLGEDERPLPAPIFALRPDEFFATDEALDFTLVAVAEVAEDGAALEHFGWSRLNGNEGKVLKGQGLNIIQHPEGGYKKLVLTGNRLLELCDSYFLYQSETQRGSSGAPVYSEQWEIVALHHRGVPDIVDGVVMTRDGLPWTSDMPESQIAWIGNEGIRVSSLVRHIKSLPLRGAPQRLRDAMFDLAPPNPFLVSRHALEIGPEPERRRIPANALGSAEIALRISVTVGPVSVPPPEAAK